MDQEDRELRDVLRELDQRCLTPSDEKFAQGARAWVLSLLPEFRVEGANLMLVKLELEQLRAELLQSAFDRERASPKVEDFVSDPGLRERIRILREASDGTESQVWVEDKLDTLLKKVWPLKLPDYSLHGDPEALRKETEEMKKDLESRELGFEAQFAAFCARVRGV